MTNLTTQRTPLWIVKVLHLINISINLFFFLIEWKNLEPLSPSKLQLILSTNLALIQLPLNCADRCRSRWPLKDPMPQTALFLHPANLLLLCKAIAARCGTCPGPDVAEPPAPKPALGTEAAQKAEPRQQLPGRAPLKLGVWALDVLGLINLNIGKAPKTPCCSLLKNLANLEAAVCLCTAIKANVLGTNLNIPVDLSLLLNYCGKKVPTGFQCA
ncbi:14 kDa proline-rich protein DC2.15-like [Asparagus officinalis]|uniref:14 kDa proline-rich protein DC2.15-like n=1 Tax=Asparagus officinalis TaxID=4686 RepID=UPI00098E2054|nr:14 kDa proline-rich protein DC2.15-like [Asparagus officinalis]